MTIITNTQAPAIIERIVRAHRLPDVFRADTTNHDIHELRFTILGVEDHPRRVRLGVKGANRPTAHMMRSVHTDGDGEYFLFRGIPHHAWQFETWEEHADIMDDFFTHYRIIDSHVPNVRQSQGRGGSPVFEDALVPPGCRTATTWMRKRQWDA